MVSSHYDEEPMLKTNGARQIAISGTQGDVPNPASENQAPFFEVTQGGQGAIVAIGWTGSWRARFIDTADGVRVAAGMARARFYLQPGEKLRTTRILVMDYTHGEDAGNKFRRLETLRRSVPFFRSDYQGGFNLNADVLQAHNAGIARLLPYTGCTVKLCDVYSLRSAYASSHGVAYWSAIFQKEEIVDWETAKKCCEEYRRVRRFFPCDFHNHRSATMDPTSWAIWQFHDPEKNEGVVMAFRRSLSPFPVARVPLKGLPEGAMGGTENLDTDVKKVLQGELEISLSKPRSSSVILYHVV